MGKGLMKNKFKSFPGEIAMTNAQKANMSWGQSQEAFNVSTKPPSVLAAQKAFSNSKSVEMPVQVLNTKRAPKANPKYQRKSRKNNRKSRKTRKMNRRH